MEFKDVLGWHYVSDVGDPIGKTRNEVMMLHKVSGKDAYTVLYKNEPVESRICKIVGKSYDHDNDLLMIHTDAGIVGYGFRKRKNSLAQLTRDFADSCYSLYTDTDMWLDTRELFGSDGESLTFFDSKIDDWKKYGPFYKIVCGDEVYTIRLSEEGKSRITKSYIKDSTALNNIIQWVKDFIHDIAELVEDSDYES